MPRTSTTTPTDNRAALRRAAIVVANLDRAAADALLGRLPAEQAQRVRRAVVELGNVAADEQSDVIEQFVKLRPSSHGASPAGIELDDGLVRKLNLGDAARSVSPGGAAADDAPFRFLHETECDELPVLLAGEHPQTVAVVLAHLPAERAAELIAALPPGIRVDALRRLAALEQTDPAVVREIEQVVKNWLKSRVGAGARTSGVAAVASILRAADTTVQHDILTGIARRDRTLAERLAPPSRPAPPSEQSVSEPPPVPNERLDSLDGPTLAGALESMDDAAAALALAGTSPDAGARAMAALPSQRAAAIRRAMAGLGPIPLADVELARTQLAAFAGQLIHARRESAENVRRAAG